MEPSWFSADKKRHFRRIACSSISSDPGARVLLSVSRWCSTTEMFCLRWKFPLEKSALQRCFIFKSLGLFESHPYNFSSCIITQSFSTGFKTQIQSRTLFTHQPPTQRLISIRLHHHSSCTAPNVQLPLLLTPSTFVKVKLNHWTINNLALNPASTGSRNLHPAAVTLQYEVTVNPQLKQIRDVGCGVWWSSAVSHHKNVPFAQNIDSQ